MANKTIAVDERVWRRLKAMMKDEKADSFGELVAKLIEKRKAVSSSMFGIDSGSGLKFTQREHEQIIRD